MAVCCSEVVTCCSLVNFFVEVKNLMSFLLLQTYLSLL